MHSDGSPFSSDNNRRQIKAIETIYRSHRFRSRLEARWACFFDWLHTDWVYESEGYSIDGTYYLPDFWLPDRQLYFEIKGAPPTPKEKRKASSLQKLTNKSVALFHGLPGDNEGSVYCWDSGGDAGEFPMRAYGIEFFGFCFYSKLWDDGNRRFYSDPPHDEWNSITVTDKIKPDQCFYDAVNAAKMARFEHGENPAPPRFK